MRFAALSSGDGMAHRLVGQNGRSAFSVVIAEMTQDVAALRVALLACSPGDVEDGRPSGRSDLADAIGRMPDVELLLAHAHQPGHRERGLRSEERRVGKEWRARGQ